jgi:hypothetical protein
MHGHLKVKLISRAYIKFFQRAERAEITVSSNKQDATVWGEMVLAVHKSCSKMQCCMDSKICRFLEGCSNQC